jgi:hypothetical protein
MSYVIHFKPTSYTAELHEKAHAALQEAGATSPDGREVHLSFEVDGGVQVIDQWSSLEQFEAFGATLMPILAGLGVEVPEPDIHPALVTVIA